MPSLQPYGCCTQVTALTNKRGGSVQPGDRHGQLPQLLLWSLVHWWSWGTPWVVSTLRSDDIYHRPFWEISVWMVDNPTSEDSSNAAFWTRGCKDRKCWAYFSTFGFCNLMPNSVFEITIVSCQDGWVVRALDSHVRDLCFKFRWHQAFFVSKRLRNCLKIGRVRCENGRISVQVRMWQSLLCTQVKSENDHYKAKYLNWSFFDM